MSAFTTSVRQSRGDSNHGSEKDEVEYTQAIREEEKWSQFAATGLTSGSSRAPVLRE